LHLFILFIFSPFIDDVSSSDYAQHSVNVCEPHRLELLTFHYHLFFIHSFDLPKLGLELLTFHYHPFFIHSFDLSKLGLELLTFPYHTFFLHSLDLSKLGPMNWNETMWLTSQLPPHQSNSVIKQD
jgi:hypothetical protein